MLVKLKISTIYMLFIILLPIPLFFYLSGNVFKEMGASSVQVLPLSFLLISIIGLFVIFNFRNKFNEIDFLQVVLFFLMICSFFYSFLFTAQEFNINLLLLYLIPQIFSYLIGKDIARYMTITKITQIMLISLSLFCFVHTVYGFMHYGTSVIFMRGSDDVFGVMSIYQKFVSYPLLLSLVIFMSIYSNIKNKSIYIFFILIDMLLTAAREPLAMLVVMNFMYIVLYFNKKIMFQIIKYIFYSIIILWTISFFINLSDLWILKKIMSIFYSETGSSNLSAGRSEQVLRFIEYSSNLNFMFGEGFILSSIFPAGTFHNQWIEYCTKGGIFVPLFVFFIFSVSIYKAFKLSKFDKNYSILGIMLLALMFISFNINTPLRTPFTSVFIWLIIGYISGSTIQLIKERKNQID